jgi:signal peptidase I
MDFSLILVVLTGISGFIWLAEVLLRRLGVIGSKVVPSDNIVVDYARSFFPVLFLVLVVRSFFFEPFRIPSSSMVPTLLIGDFIFVNKYTYGLRLPVIHTKVLDVGKPTRGDVMVFRLPSNPSINYIKRLVGMPGDSVLYRNKRIYINGELVELTGNATYERGDRPPAQLRTEQLGEAQHDILLEPFSPSREGEFKVPLGHYFMMGDNRDNSADSRYFGFIERKQILGRANTIVISLDLNHHYRPRWERFFTRLK